MSPGKIAAVVAGCALLATLLWLAALRVAGSGEPAGESAAHAAAACDCSGTADSRPEPSAAQPAREASGAAPPQENATVAARYAVCEREEAPARLARVALVAGRPELWALHCGRSLQLVSIEEHAGTLVPQRVALLQVTSPSPAEVAVAVEPSAADLNGDGRTDLIAPVLLVDAAGTARGGALHALWQRATGGFEAPTRVLHAAPSALVPAALDADPVQDLALLHRNDPSTAQPDELWLVQGGPSPLRIAQRVAGIGSSGLAALDLDLDGKQDLVVPSAREGRLRMWLTSRGALAEVEPLDVALPGVRQVLAVDLDGDGARELVLSADRVFVLRPAAGGPAAPEAIAGSEDLRDLHVADADANGKPDLVGYAHPDLIALLAGAQQPFTRKPLASLRGDAAVLFARLAQLDRDARPDLVLAVLSRDGKDVELAIARNLDAGAIVRLSDASAPISESALVERFALQ